jgi:hypothetical protein
MKNSQPDWKEKNCQSPVSSLPGEALQSHAKAECQTRVDQEQLTTDN